MAYGGSFKRLRDGSWGVLIHGIIPATRTTVTVNVRKRSGECIDVTADVFWRGDDSAHQPVALARVRRSGRTDNASYDYMLAYFRRNTTAARTRIQTLRTYGEMKLDDAEHLELRAALAAVGRRVADPPLSDADIYTDSDVRRAEVAAGWDATP